MKKNLIFLFVMIFGFVASANALSVGGYEFDDNAFADSLISYSGNYTFVGGNLEQAVTGNNLWTYAFSKSNFAYLDVGFIDNYLCNGDGYDLAIFDIGTPDYFGVKVGEITIDYITKVTGTFIGSYGVNVALIDLDDFGIHSGEFLSNLFLNMYNKNGSTVPSLAVVGAYNSCDYILNDDLAPVPEPATILMIGTGILGLVVARRRQCRTKKLNVY